MTESFNRWDQHDLVRALLIRRYLYEEENRRRKSAESDFRDGVEQLELKKKEVASKLEFIEKEGKKAEELVRDAKEKLAFLRRKAAADPKLREYIKGCGKGIMCETIDDVKAVHKLALSTFRLRTCIVIDPKSPVRQRILEEARKRELPVRDFNSVIIEDGIGGLKL